MKRFRRARRRVIEAARETIALVVASFRRPDALATLLASLSRQTIPRSQFEAAVVIDGIDESEGEYRRVLEAAQREPGLNLRHAFQPNAGQSAARHRAISMTEAHLLCIVDDDMDLSPEFLAEHVAAHAGGRGRTVVIGRVEPEAGWQKGPLYEAARTKAMLELHQALALGRKTATASALVTQNVSLPRELFLGAGGFDESLRLGEDTELGLRLERMAAEFRFASGAWAIHRSRVGSYRTWLDRQVQYGRNAIYVFEKSGREPGAHPLRDLVNGSKLNALAVHALCWSEPLARAGMAALRGMGAGLQRAGLAEPAIATHKAIRALAYHLGVRQGMGSWASVMEAKRAFRAMPGRPLDPT